MLTSEVLERIDSLLKELNPSNKIIEILRYTSEAYKSAYTHGLLHVIDNVSQLDRNVYNKLHEATQNLLAQCSPITSRIRIPALQALQKEITSFVNSGANLTRVEPALIDQTNTFSDIFDQAMNSPQAANLIKLMLSGRDLYIQLVTLRDNLYIVKSSLSIIPATRQLSEDWEEIKIELPDVLILEDFAKQINLLIELNGVICNLLKMSETEFRIKIVKVETDCTFLDLLVSKEVLTVLLPTLTVVVGFIYLNYTSRGKKIRDYEQLKKEISDGIQIIKDADELGQRLEQRGYKDIAGENIKRAYKIITDKIVDFVHGQQYIKLHSTKLYIEEITAEDQQKLELLQRYNPLQLTEGNKPKQITERVVIIDQEKDPKEDNSQEK